MTAADIIAFSALAIACPSCMFLAVCMFRLALSMRSDRCREYSRKAPTWMEGVK